jgi:hypothetical protein
MAGVMDTDELTPEQESDLAAIRARKKQIVTAHRIKKGAANNRPVIPLKHNTRGRLNTTEMRRSLGSMGIDTSAAEARIRERSQSRGRKRSRWVEWHRCVCERGGWEGGGSKRGGGQHDAIAEEPGLDEH